MWGLLAAEGPQHVRRSREHIASISLLLARHFVFGSNVGNKNKKYRIQRDKRRSFLSVCQKGYQRFNTETPPDEGAENKVYDERGGALAFCVCSSGKKGWSTADGPHRYTTRVQPGVRV
jgi:hypothetical protein